MTQGRSASELAPRRPTSSLLGPRTLTCIGVAIAVYLTFAIVALLDLELGAGASFFEPFNSVHLEIPGQEWTKKGDNYTAPTLFMLLAVTLASVGYAFSYGDVFREKPVRNIYLNIAVVALSGFILFLLWAPPNDVGCLFRTNCDNVKSKSLQFPFIQRISTGGVGGGFLGPQNLHCRSKSGMCWVVPPNDLHLQTSWRPIPGIDRPKAPFDTFEAKTAYCKEHPYKPNASNDPGNKWCFYPSKENGYEPQPPKPFEQPVEGCTGPNNCFGDAFKLSMTGILVGCAVALHASYAFLLYFFAS